MKWAIFENGDLRNIALTDSEKDSLMQHRPKYVAKELTDQQASDGLDGKKEFRLDGDAIVTTDIGLDLTNELWKEYFELWVSSSIRKVGAFLNANPNHPDFNEWQTVNNQLLAINLREMEDLYPLTQTPQEWFSAQPGNSQKKLLQLPQINLKLTYVFK